MNQEFKLVIYVAVSVISVIDYITVWQGRKLRFVNCDVRVIPIEECVGH